MALDPTKTVRLACANCDRSDFDFITPEKFEELKTQGWQDVSHIQSYEQSITVYDNPADAPAGYCVLDWYTDIGMCPECSQEEESENAEVPPQS